MYPILLYQHHTLEDLSDFRIGDTLVIASDIPEVDEDIKLETGKVLEDYEDQTPILFTLNF